MKNPIPSNREASSQGPRGPTTRILITGATGYLGTALLRAWTRRPGRPEIHVLLNPQHADLSWVPVADLKGRVVLHVGGLTDRKALEAALPGTDTVVHLAADTNATTSPRRAAEVEEANLANTKRVADAMRHHDVPHVVFPSTLSMCSPRGGVALESTPLSAMKPPNPYAQSKLDAERHLSETSKSMGLRATVLRMATIFGASPRLKCHTAVNKFVLLAITGRAIPVWQGAERQVRPYLDIQDAVAAFTKVITTPSAAGTTYQLRTEDRALSEVVAAIRASIPSTTIQTVPAPYPLGPGFRTETKRLEATGFRWRGSIERGVKELTRVLAPFEENASSATRQARATASS